jgi:hypothetical protein
VSYELKNITNISIDSACYVFLTQICIRKSWNNKMLNAQKIDFTAMGLPIIYSVSLSRMTLHMLRAPLRALNPVAKATYSGNSLKKYCDLDAVA